MPIIPIIKIIPNDFSRVNIIVYNHFLTEIGFFTHVKYWRKISFSALIYFFLTYIGIENTEMSFTSPL